MNRIQFVCHGVKTVFLVSLLFCQGSNVYAENKECWANFYEGSQYSGKHFTVDGPVRLKDLSNINGENWDSRIDSLKTGPKTKLTVYKNLNCELTSADMAEHPDLMKSMGVTDKDIKEDSELIFNANATVHDLSDFQFHHKIRSLKLECD